jgi:hypothetical protein
MRRFKFSNRILDRTILLERRIGMRFTTADNLIHALSAFKEKLDLTYAAKTHGTHLTLGTTSSTAYRGDLGNVAYVHSQAAHAPSNAQKNSDITKAEIEAKLIGTITSHTHNAIASRGSVTCESGVAGRPAVSGLSMSQVYNNGYPTPYGNVISLRGMGDGQILVGWSGTDGAHAPVYVRSKRDNTTTANWSDWAQIYTTANKPTPADIGAAASSHGTHLTIGTGASNAAAGNHNHTQLTGEVRFPGTGTYSDPWSGTTCAIKATGNIGCTGGLRANGGVATCAAPNGVATSDGATYVANFRYAQSRGICDLGANSVPGRLYIRSGQGTAGSGVYIETKVTNGNAYMQYLSPEAGTIALTSHLSDRTRKDNIVYTNDEKSNFSNNDFYNFIKDDLDLATYTLKENYAATDTHTKLNFIAQDILWDFNRNEENKVGNLIVQAEAAMENQYSLKYDADNFIAVIAGALKEAINEIELLKSKNEELIERLLEIELNEGGEQ